MQSISNEGLKLLNTPRLLIDKTNSINTLCPPQSNESQCFRIFSGCQRASKCYTYHIHALSSELNQHRVQSLLRCPQGSKLSHRTNTKCDGCLANLLLYRQLLSYRARNHCEH